VLRRLKEEVHEFEASLEYIARPYPKNKQTNNLKLSSGLSLHFTHNSGTYDEFLRHCEN
jgi:hypothetical protein